MTLGGVIFLLILIWLIIPEIIIIPIGIVIFVIAIFLEFILRLFGKSFDDPPSDQIKKRMKKKKRKNIDIDIKI